MQTQKNLLKRLQTLLHQFWGLSEKVDRLSYKQESAKVDEDIAKLKKVLADE